MKFLQNFFSNKNLEEDMTRAPGLPNRVARFNLIQHAKIGENIPNDHKIKSKGRTIY
jgi:hypothetical protein